MEKISVVIPAYNAEKTIEKAVRSVLSGADEVIVLDDGSTDGTGEVLEKLAGENAGLKVFRQENAGVSAARNRGIREAGGKWLLTLDDDDFLEDGILKRMAEKAEAEELDLCICGMRLVYPDRTEECSEPSFTARKDAFLKEKMVSLYDGHLLTTHANKLYDLDLIRKKGIYYDESLKINEDIDFVFRYLAFTEKIGLIPEAGFDYVQHEAGKSLITTYQKNVLSSALLCEKDLEALLEGLKEDEKKKCLSASMQQRMLTHILSCLGQMYYRGELADAERKEAVRALLKEETFRNLLKNVTPEDLKTGTAVALLKGNHPSLYHFLCKGLYRGYH